MKKKIHATVQNGRPRNSARPRQPLPAKTAHEGKKRLKVERNGESIQFRESGVELVRAGKKRGLFDRPRQEAEAIQIEQA